MHKSSKGGKQRKHLKTQIKNKDLSHIHHQLRNSFKACYTESCMTTLHKVISVSAHPCFLLYTVYQIFHTFPLIVQKPNSILYLFELAFSFFNYVKWELTLCPKADIYIVRISFLIKFSRFF